MAGAEGFRVTNGLNVHPIAQLDAAGSKRSPALPALFAALRRAGAAGSVIPEFVLPGSSHVVDALLAGRDALGAPHLVVVEAKPGGVDPRWAADQAEAYAAHLRARGFERGAAPGIHVAVVTEGPGGEASPVAVAARIAPLLAQPPLAEDLDRLAATSRSPAPPLAGDRPLLDAMADLVLLGPQRDVQAAVQEAFVLPGKTVVLVTGGPGTGKTALGLRLLQEALDRGYLAQHASGSRLLTTWARAASGRSHAKAFRYFNGYADAVPDGLDLLVCDEAHRIRASSQTRWAPRSGGSRAQVDELVAASRVTVFLLDERARASPEEVGTPASIQAAAARNGARLLEFTLDAAFRPPAAATFLRLVDAALLGADPPAEAPHGYEIGVHDDPASMEAALRRRIDEGWSARIVAGLCWPWSPPGPDGALAPDVRIGDWARPWHRRPTGGERPGSDPLVQWATSPAGFGEIGTIYAAQGFEFDYVGVIFGPDLVRRGERWEARPERGRATGEADALPWLARTYRVLLTRGLRGCHVYSVDAKTRAHLRKVLLHGGLG